MQPEFEDITHPPPRDNFGTLSLWPERIELEELLANPRDTLAEVRVCVGKALVVEQGGRDLGVLISPRSLRWAMQELWELDQMRLRQAELQDRHCALPDTWGDVLSDWRGWPRRIKEFFVGAPAYEHPLASFIDDEATSGGGWVWRDDE